MRTIVLIVSTLLLVANAIDNKNNKQRPQDLLFNAGAQKLWKHSQDANVLKELRAYQSKYMKANNIPNEMPASLEDDSKNFAFSKTTPGVLSFYEPNTPFLSKRANVVAAKRGDKSAYDDVVSDFMRSNSNSFGLRDVSNEILQEKTRRLDENSTNVYYKQQYNGLPVYGGAILFNFRDESLSIGFVVNTLVNTNSILEKDAKITVERAIEIAREASGNPQDVIVMESTLQYYNKDHYFERVGPTVLCWVITLKATQPLVMFNHRLFINALTGKLEQDVDLSNGALNRRFYKGTISTTTYQEGQTPSQSDTVLLTMIQGAGDMYYAMRNMTSYDSFNNQGTQMKGLYDAALTTSDGKSACPNAFWDSVRTNYCPNLGTYDVVVHEWGHAYTEYFSNLEYQGMSGALNEGYSDIFAETLQTLSNIPSAYAVRTNYNCITNIASSGGRWIVGDQVTGVSGITNGLRDMWSPNCKDQPQNTSDTAYAICDTVNGADYGGVHTNSGIPNRAYASLVDGIIGDGTVPGIGFVKAINIYTRAATSHTSSTGFSVHASLLNSACSALVGQTIKNPITGANHPSTITSGDCTQLGKALTLVGMTAGLCGGNSNAGAEYPTLTELYPLYQPRGLSSVVAFVGRAFKSGAGCIFTSGNTGIAFATGTVYVSTNSQNEFLFCNFNGATFSSYSFVNATAANNLVEVQGGDFSTVANAYGTMGMYTNPQVGSWSSDGVKVTMTRNSLGGFFQQYSGCNPPSYDDNGDIFDCLSCWWTSDFSTMNQYKATLIDSSRISCKIPATYNPDQTTFYYSMNGWAFSLVDARNVSSASNVLVSFVVLIVALFISMF